jgi:drug/metabolite transporter (DMT)-like permease
MSSTSTLRRAYGAWVLVCVLWGTTYLGIRIALDTIPPMLMGGFRWTVAGALILGVLRLRGDGIPGRRQWPGLAVLGVLMIGVGNGAVVWAEQTVPSGLTAVLVAGTPFWMLGIERLAGAAPPLTLRRIAGLVVGFAGIVLLVWPELEMGKGARFLFGVLATQCASIGWAIGSVYSRRRGAAENVLAAAACQMLLGGLVMLLLGTVAREWAVLSFTPRTAGALAYLLVFGSIAGFSAYGYALKHLPLATVSLYAYVNPVIAVVLGTIMLGEPFTPRIAIAGAIVLGGMALVRR